MITPKSLWQPWKDRYETFNTEDQYDSNIEEEIKYPRQWWSNRGGAQIPVDPIYDPIYLAFLEIHAIKTKRKLDSQFSQSRSKLKKIRQSLKDHRVVLQMFAATTIYLGALTDGKKLGISNRELRSRIPNQSLDNTRINNTNTRITPIKGAREILLPGSNLILAEKPTQQSSTRPSSAGRFKNYQKKKKKRLGKLSDFSRKEFENSEIIENNTSRIPSKEGKIRIRTN